MVGALLVAGAQEHGKALRFGCANVTKAHAARPALIGGCTRSLFARVQRQAAGQQAKGRRFTAVLAQRRQVRIAGHGRVATAIFDQVVAVGGDAPRIDTVTADWAVGDDRVAHCQRPSVIETAAVAICAISGKRAVVHGQRPQIMDGAAFHCRLIAAKGAVDNHRVAIIGQAAANTAAGCVIVEQAAVCNGQYATVGETSPCTRTSDLVAGHGAVQEGQLTFVANTGALFRVHCAANNTQVAEGDNAAGRNGKDAHIAITIIATVAADSDGHAITVNRDRFADR